MNNEPEHQIALRVINSHIDSGKKFTYEQVREDILNRGGILRISIGVTIRMYLKNLDEIGLLTFDPKEGEYSVVQNALQNHVIMA